MEHLAGRLGQRVEQLARWWTSASQEERFLLLRKAIETPQNKIGAKDPTLGEVRLAIYLAEAEAGEVAEG